MRLIRNEKTKRFSTPRLADPATHLVRTEVLRDKLSINGTTIWKGGHFVVGYSMLHFTSVAAKKLQKKIDMLNTVNKKLR